MSIESLAILTQTGTGKSYLATQYGKVVENVQNGCISTQLKNQDLSGEPNAGTVVARRFVNAKINDYGTARSGGGEKLKAADVNVDIDQDKECIEEVEDKDARMYGVEGLIERRMRTQQLGLIKELERAFWTEAKAKGSVFTPSAKATTAAKKADELIVSMETTKSDFVDGVYREQMALVLSPSAYTDLQEDIDTIPNLATGNNYQVFHNVKVYSSTDLPTGVDMVCIVEGAIAQPVRYTPDEAGKVPMSNSYHFGFFVSYGTKAVSPELIKYISTPTTPVTPPSGGDKGDE